MEGIFFSNWLVKRSERYSSLIERLIERRGVPPVLEVSTVPSYDVIRIIGDSFKDGVGTDAVTTLREHLYSLKNYSGVSGGISIDPDGVTRSFPIVMQQYRDGKVLLAPANTTSPDIDELYDE